LCPATGTNNIQHFGDELMIFPNPAQDYCIINFRSSNEAGLAYEVRNLLGAIVIPPQSLFDTQRVDLTNLVAGSYILIVNKSTGQVSRFFSKIR
jgi:hypothetical protein